MSLIDPVAEDAAQVLFGALEAESSDKAVKLKHVTKDPDVLSDIMRILPNLQFKGLVSFKGPINKNTKIRLAYG